MSGLQLGLKPSEPLGKGRDGLVYTVVILAIYSTDPSFDTEPLRKEFPKLCLKVASHVQGFHLLPIRRSIVSCVFHRLYFVLNIIMIVVTLTLGCDDNYKETQTD